jgi:predicted RecA/RadA family phage recombinase
MQNWQVRFEIKKINIGLQQMEMTLDQIFLIYRHPRTHNLWGNDRSNFIRIQPGSKYKAIGAFDVASPASLLIGFVKAVLCFNAHVSGTISINSKSVFSLPEIFEEISKSKAVIWHKNYQGRT